MPNRRTSKNISHRAKRRRARALQRVEDLMRLDLVLIPVATPLDQTWDEFSKRILADVASRMGVPCAFVKGHPYRDA